MPKQPSAPQKSNITAELDDIVQEQLGHGKLRVMVSVSGLAARIDMNARTLRQRGFPSWYDQNMPGCRWVKYHGLEIDLEAWAAERGLIEGLTTYE